MYKHLPENKAAFRQAGHKAIREAIEASHPPLPSPLFTLRWAVRQKSSDVIMVRADSIGDARAQSSTRDVRSKDVAKGRGHYPAADSVEMDEHLSWPALFPRWQTPRHELDETLLEVCELMNRKIGREFAAQRCEQDREDNYADGKVESRRAFEMDLERNRRIACFEFSNPPDANSGVLGELALGHFTAKARALDVTP